MAGVHRVCQGSRAHEGWRANLRWFHPGSRQNLLNSVFANSHSSGFTRKNFKIWEQYAPRLFEIFDLHRADLWQDYGKFLKEVYDISGRNPAIKPSLDKV